MTQRKAVFGIRMAEAGGVEIDTELLRLGPIDPTAKIIDGEFVALWQWRAVRCIARMQIEAQWSWNVCSGLLDVGHELGRIGRLARIVTRRHATVARARFFRGLEACHVIALPAMHGDWDLIQRLKRSLGIDADCGELFFCNFVD